MIFWVIFFWQPKVCKFTLIWKIILFWQRWSFRWHFVWYFRWYFSLQNRWYFGWYFFGSPKCVNSRWFWRWYYFGSPAPKFCSPLRRNFVRPTVGCDFCPAPKFCSVFCLVKRRAVFLFDFECEFGALRWNFVACNVAAIVSWVFVDQTIPRTSRVQPGPHGPTRAHMGPYGPILKNVSVAKTKLKKDVQAQLINSKMLQSQVQES